MLQDPARRLPQPCARPCLHTLWVSSPHTAVSCQRTWRRAQTGITNEHLRVIYVLSWMMRIAVSCTSSVSAWCNPCPSGQLCRNMRGV